MDGPRSDCDICQRPFDFEDRASRMAPHRFARDERGLLFVCLDCKNELREEWALAQEAMDDLRADSYRDTL